LSFLKFFFVKKLKTGFYHPFLQPWYRPQVST